MVLPHNQYIFIIRKFSFWVKWFCLALVVSLKFLANCQNQETIANTSMWLSALISYCTYLMSKIQTFLTVSQVSGDG